MMTATELMDYVEEIRQRVCCRCPRPVPPDLDRTLAAPLSRLVGAVHDGRADLVASAAGELCARCGLPRGAGRPDTVEELAARLVQAVEAVDDRREQRQILRDWLAHHARPGRVSAAALIEAYEQATGTCLGCD